MSFFASPWALVGFVCLVTIVSLAMAPRRVSVDGFFEGTAASGQEPGLWTLVLSQVTTWIFARSLMNAAILGYFYGIAGVLAYTAYYISFLTGAYIVNRLREDHVGSVQHWLGERFGLLGHGTYNVIIALRLLSEVFSNLIVVGLIFAAAFPDVSFASTASIIALAIVGLVYSTMGGLRASLRTDVVQMLIFLIVFVLAFVVMITGDNFSFGEVLTSEGKAGARAGWVLFVVAFLQVFSYPVHDPVMMDRGFLADQSTTRKSFVLAFLLSAACIFGFGLFGIQAFVVGQEYSGQLLGSWAAMFGPFVYFLIAASLLVSALSTLDSALASSARLVIDEVSLMARTVWNGRLAMLGFAVTGGALTLAIQWAQEASKAANAAGEAVGAGAKALTVLFDAVAVSGTASMFLTPILVLAFAGWIVPRWAYFATWIVALTGAAAYMFRGADWVTGSVDPWVSLFSAAEKIHKYDQLLVICVMVLGAGFAICILGLLSNRLLARAH